MQEAHDPAALAVLVLGLGLAAASDTAGARCGVRSLGRAIPDPCGRVVVAELAELPDVLLVVGRVPEGVVAAPELLGRRLDAALRAGDGAAVLACGATGGSLAFTAAGWAGGATGLAASFGGGGGVVSFL